MTVRAPRLHLPFPAPSRGLCDGRGFARGDRRRRRVGARIAPRLAEGVRFRGPGVRVAEEFLASDLVEQTRALLLDIAMPRMAGPELQQELTRRGHQIPIVFITANGYETIRPRMLAEGAVECLHKPFGEAALLWALNAALRLG